MLVLPLTAKAAAEDRFIHPKSIQQVGRILPEVALPADWARRAIGADLAQEFVHSLKDWSYARVGVVDSNFLALAIEGTVSAGAFRGPVHGHNGHGTAVANVVVGTSDSAVGAHGEIVLLHARKSGD